MKPADSQASRCGIDTIELARVEKLLRDHALHEPEESRAVRPTGHPQRAAETYGPALRSLFSEQELKDAGEGAGRVASLAGRFAAKEACCKLFPRETALGLVGPADFAIHRDSYGAPTVVVSQAAQAVLDRNRVAGLRVSITHTAANASAIAWADPRRTEVPWFGKLLYHVWPYRRDIVLGNLRRVFGETLDDTEIRRIAQAYCAHYARFLIEFVRLPLMSAKRKESWIRVENMESPIRAHEKGKGLLLLTGHFGNFEVATVAGITQFPQYRGLFHFVRRPLKPKLLNDFVTRRFRRAGFGTLAKRGSLDTIIELLGKGAIVVYVFDQHAGRKDGVIVDFFGHPAGTFKSVALLALETGAPVVPAYSWREPDGSHVLRFEEPLPLIEHEDAAEVIRANTRAYNAAIERMVLRHPEQWIWMHRRWKVEGTAKAK